MVDSAEHHDVKEDRSCADSRVETTHLVLPPDTNMHGTAFGGRIMQWMDIICGISSARHCGRPVVTVAVDELVFRRPIQVGDVVVMKACVNYAGNTSMEVGVRVERELSAERSRVHCLSGYFTFVGLGEDGKPMPVPKIVPQSEDEKRRYQKAQERRARRLENREALLEREQAAK